MTFVPGEFIVRMRKLHGLKGKEWSEALPQLIDRSAGRFGVKIEAPYQNLSWNFILKAAQHDGTPVVLKFSLLKEELTRELNVLNAYAGRGAIQVLDADEESGVLMLERADPGTPLSSIEDDLLATGIFCDVFKRLHSPASTDHLSATDQFPTKRVQYPSINQFPTIVHYPTIRVNFAAIERYRHRYSGATSPLPANWVEHAEEYLEYLISSTEESVLLHVDLHHENILRQGDDDWAVIDPKGFVGDIHFDTIQYLLNYEDRGGDCETVLRSRIGIMSERLGLDPRRIAMWGVARGVLEACWILEDGGTDWHRGIQITERFAKYLD